VRFSSVTSVNIADSAATPDAGPAVPERERQHQVQAAGHTPYSALAPTHVTFAAAPLDVAATPGAASDATSSDSSSAGARGGGGAALARRSLNAGATPRRCVQSVVHFAEAVATEVGITGVSTPVAARGDGAALSAEETLRLSLNAGHTPGARRLLRDGGSVLRDDGNVSDGVLEDPPAAREAEDGGEGVLNPAGGARAGCYPLWLPMPGCSRYGCIAHAQ
jgi:hypothetical protein